MDHLVVFGFFILYLARIVLWLLLLDLGGHNPRLLFLSHAWNDYHHKQKKKGALIKGVN